MQEIGTAGEALLALGAFTLLVLGPGAALTLLLWPESELDAGVLAGVALSIGTGLPALLAAWLRLGNLGWLSGPFAVAYAVAAFAALAYLVLRRPRVRVRWRVSLPGILMLIVLALALYARLYTVRDVQYGQLGDSLHHTVITQLLIQNRGLFSDWSPYGPMTTLTYHVGFQMVAALFDVITSIPVERSVVLVGQLFNVATVVVTYSTTLLVCRRVLDRDQDAEWAALFAALVPAFLNTQPGYYVNWGRYTQLAGQVILPTIGALVLAGTRDAQAGAGPRRWVPLLAVAVGGVMVTHYRVSLFVVAMAASSVLLLAIESRDSRRSLSWTGVLAMAFAAGAVLAGPWLYTTTAGKLPALYGGIIASAISPQAEAPSGNLPAVAPFYLKAWLALGALAAAAVAARARAWNLLHVAGWAVAILAFPMLYLLALPGSGVIDSFASYLALYIPVATLVGYLGARVLAQGRAVLPVIDRPASAVAALAVCAASVWGTSFQRNFLDRSQGEMVSAADAAALAWIRSNTPADARFFVSGFPCFGGVVCGNDAGWWLGFVARRQSSLPPILYTTEETNPPDFRVALQAMYSKIRGKSTKDAGPVSVDLADPAVLAVLKANSFGYVFVGSARFPDKSDAIDVQKLARSRDFELVFDSGGSRVYRILP